ncbi:5,6-dimethylbenzimidazole synthase [Saccharobesus litoralis]|uniref:5,6-dimethylbenzimidazole synthase n=1 Tax=Saccharobesus litoralis TaxID=2172099 RepID=A0A2S0VLV4_9ALTE|nr:5,6-dimethylbenzimidazole synthase [Saccharobesus litoralis]AWB65197.1 5,6-dimethylbenzimidazole synthase [Saccharobesus litoralis]
MSKKFNIHEQQVLQDVMRLRRDVRGNRFNEAPVAEEIIQQLLDAALAAPSVGYSQPWQFVVIDDNQVKQTVYKSFKQENAKAVPLFTGKQAELYQQLKLEGIVEAPINLAVFYVPKDKPVLGQTSMSDMGRFSVVCAIQNLWLMARALNVGVGWVSIVDPEVVKQAVNAPENAELIGYLCIGYVEEFLDEPELKTLGWDKTKQREQVVSFNRFE